MKNIDLETDRLIIKRLSLVHLSDEYLSWLNNSLVTTFLEIKEDYTIDMLKAYIQKHYENEVYIWAIHLKKSNKHIGNIKIDPISYGLKSAEYDILMGDTNNWGRGYAKEASLRIIKYCFDELELSRITLGVVEDNINAVALYKTMEFKIDIVIKDSDVYNQKMCNSLRMSLNANDVN